jgi:hypothetical protein
MNIKTIAVLVLQTRVSSIIAAAPATNVIATTTHGYVSLALFRTALCHYQPGDVNPRHQSDRTSSFSLTGRWIKRLPTVRVFVGFGVFLHGVNQVAAGFFGAA